MEYRRLRKFSKPSRPEIERNRYFSAGSSTVSGQGAQALGTYLRHPQYFAGIITECAHPGLIYNPDFKDAEGKPVILITREQEWNRGWNEMMAQIFSDRGMNVKLIMTPGEHHIGDAKELYNACEIIDSLFIENTIPHF